MRDDAVPVSPPVGKKPYDANDGHESSVVGFRLDLSLLAEISLKVSLLMAPAVSSAEVRL